VIPAYAAINASSDSLAAFMLEILMASVSTHRLANVLPRMAEIVSVSKSQVSRTTIEAGAAVLKALAEKSFKEVEILALRIDGIQLSDCNVVCTVGVDPRGVKHVLGLREWATENADLVKSLLEDLVA
jgi:transposase-like protein